MNLIFNLIVSVLLICAGLYVLYEELFVSYSGIHGRYQPFGAGLILFGSGVVWLWWYVVGPIVLKAPLTRGVVALGLKPASFIHVELDRRLSHAARNKSK